MLSLLMGYRIVKKKKSELPELNQRPLDLQSNALPTELSSVCSSFPTCLLNTRSSAPLHSRSTRNLSLSLAMDDSVITDLLMLLRQLLPYSADWLEIPSRT